MAKKSGYEANVPDSKQFDELQISLSANFVGFITFTKNLKTPFSRL